MKPISSMVVSVLVDPREGGDGDIDGMIGGPKYCLEFLLSCLWTVQRVKHDSSIFYPSAVYVEE
ncbi:unnamed protein product [Brassica oleracea]